MEISVSILNSEDRIKDIIKLNDTSCDYLHIDVMDGKFVPDTQFTIEQIIKLISVCKKKLDVHLMVENPISYIEKLVNYNIEYITFHKEIDKDINELINILKKHNIGVGISIKPNTNVSEIVNYLDKIDLVLIMSVEPGKGGQSFIESSFEKVKELRKIIDDNKLDVKIEIDGGVKDTNIDLIKKSGVDISVVGSFITKSDDFEASIKKLK